MPEIREKDPKNRGNGVCKKELIEPKLKQNHLKMASAVFNNANDAKKPKVPDGTMHHVLSDGDESSDEDDDDEKEI